MTSGSVSATNGAASYADLRSLGAQRTLVLLNGKRVVSNPFSSVAVDLNTLPTSSLDRIEVLPDGASATYGTDAIAGVINFITRKEYKGLTVGGEIQLPEEGGGETYLANVLGGWGDMATQGWNVYGGFNWRKQQPLGGTERDFMQTSWIPSQGFNGLSPTTFPANYTQTPNVANANPSLPSCFPPSSITTTVLHRSAWTTPAAAPTRRSSRTSFRIRNNGRSSCAVVWRSARTTRCRPSTSGRATRLKRRSRRRPRVA